MELYIVRHSKTKWNELRKLQGHMDSPLTDEGIENAKALLDYLNQNNYVFDYIYSSPIKRAKDTALILAQGQDIVYDERLMEMNFGDYEGCFTYDLMNMNPSLYDTMWNNPKDFDRLPNGESYEEVLSRIESFFNDLYTLNNDSKVLIVTHGMYLILILAYILHIKKKDLSSINRSVVEGCSLNKIVYKDHTWSIEYTNKNHFLPHVSNIVFNK